MSTNAKENTSFVLLCKLLINGGTQVLREMFDSIHPPQHLKYHLMDRANHHILKNLKSKGIIRQEQWSKLYPSVGVASSASFDITLLTLLLQSICNLPTLTKGWEEEPSAASISKEDDIARLRLYRNKLYGHTILRQRLSDAVYVNYWKDITAVLVRLGLKQEDIDNLSKQPVDSGEGIYYIRYLCDWSVYDGIRQKTKQDKKSSVQKLGDMESYSKRLRSGIIHRTDKTSNKLDIGMQSFKTDDIFINLTIRHSILSNQQINTTSNQVTTCSDLFSSVKGEAISKSILVTGDPGIGKTLFSNKLVRDWAMDVITIPNIKFTYLIQFRHLNMIDEFKPFSLCEFLNMSCLLDETTLVHQTRMQYIIDHPEQLFLVIDGFDEYKDRHQVSNLLASQFPNDPKAKMPVAVLVIKLLNKEILRDSTIMITSRHGQATTLDKTVHFDHYVRISGFSESQVLEYVANYFDSKPKDVKNMALRKVKENEHYITFGRVPFMCFLLCLVIEWEIENSLYSDNSVSLTLTEFYCQVIHCIEKNFNRAIGSLYDEAASSSAVENLLDVFSRLAARLYKQNRFIFTKIDLMDLNLTEEERLCIESSNILCCNPVAANTPFRQLTFEYTFNNISFLEFFVARRYVSICQIPMQGTEMIYQFMSGLMVPVKHEQLMSELLECVAKLKEELFEYAQRHLSLRCLYEYKDQVFVGRHLMKEPRRYWDSNGEIRLYNIVDMDCKLITMLIDRMNAVKHLLSPPPQGLYIGLSSLSSSSLNTLLVSLTCPSSTISELSFSFCKLDDTCAKCICQNIPYSEIKKLDLSANKITDEGAVEIVNQCASTLDYLDLSGNPISDECKERTLHLVKDKYPGLNFIITSAVSRRPDSDEIKLKEKLSESVDYLPQREKDDYRKQSNVDGDNQELSRNLELEDMDDDSSLEDDSVQFQNILTTLSCNNEMTEEEVERYLSELKNCSRRQSWIRCFENAIKHASDEWKRNFVDEMRKIYEFLRPKLTENEERRNRDEPVADLTFLAHGKVRKPHVRCIQHYYNSFVNAIILYVPWGSNLDASAAYGIVTGDITRENVNYIGEVLPEPPKGWNILPFEATKIPEVVFTQVATSGDPAYQQLRNIDTAFQTRARGCLIPFLPEELHIPEIPLWFLCCIIGVLGRENNVTYKIHIASCLSPMNRDILSREIFPSELWPTVDSEQYCTVPMDGFKPNSSKLVMNAYNVPTDIQGIFHALNCYFTSPS